MGLRLLNRTKGSDLTFEGQSNFTRHLSDVDLRSSLVRRFSLMSSVSGGAGFWRISLCSGLQGSGFRSVRCAFESGTLATIGVLCCWPKQEIAYELRGTVYR